MNTTSVAIVNHVDIITLTHEGEVYVPIKPICEAIGVSLSGQRQRINEDELLHSVVKHCFTTGADGKTYEMLCIPLKYIFGWLFTINENRVSPEAREAVTAYRRECYETLYNHFAGQAKRRQEENEAEIALLNELNEMHEEERHVKKRCKEIQHQLERLRKERLNPAPSLF